MADQTAIVLTIDSSGAAAGAQQFARSIDTIKASASGGAAAVDAAATATARLAQTQAAARAQFNDTHIDLVQTEKDWNAYMASMNGGAAATRTAAQEMSLGRAEIAAYAENAQRAAGSMGAFEKAMGGGTNGASRLRYSLVSLLDTQAGMPGSIGRVVTGFAGLALGGPVMIGALAGIAGLVYIYDELTKSAKETAKANADFLSGIADAAQKAFTASHPYYVLLGQQAEILAIQIGLEKQLADERAKVAFVTAKTRAKYGGPDLAKEAELQRQLDATKKAGNDIEAAYDIEAKKRADDANNAARQAETARLTAEQTYAAQKGSNDATDLQNAGQVFAANQLIYDNQIKANAEREKAANLAKGAFPLLNELDRVEEDRRAKTTLTTAQYDEQEKLLKAMLLNVAPQAQVTPDRALIDPLYLDPAQAQRDAAALQKYTDGVVRDAKNAFDSFENQIDRSLRTTFEGVVQHGIGSFQDLWDSVLKGFEKLLADMAAKALAAKIAPSLAQTFGVGNGGISGSGFAANQIGNADSTPSGAGLVPAIGIGLAVVGIVSTLLDAAQKAKADAEAFQTAESAFATTLDLYVKHANGSATALTDALAAAAANRKTIEDQAKSVEHLGMVSAVDQGSGAGSVIATYNAAMTAIAKAAQQTTDQLIAAAQELVSQNHYTLEARAAAAAGNTELAASITRYAAEQKEMTDAVAAGWSKVDLTTLKAAQDAEDLAAIQARIAAQQKVDADAQLSLQQRLESATNDPVLAAQIRQTQEANELADALTNHWSAANIALLHQVQTAEDAKTAATALATAQQAQATAVAAAATATAQAAAADAAARQKFITDGNTAAAYSADLVLRNAKLSGDAEQLRYANLNALQVGQAKAASDAAAQMAAGVISQEQYNVGLATQAAEYQSALASMDGTVGGVTKAVNDLAVAAQTLSENVSRFSQQSTVFGTSLADQATGLRALFGFSGKSDDAIKAMYTSVTPGSALTPAQKTLDDNIATYFSTEKQYLATLATAAAQAPTVAAAAATSLNNGGTTTYGNTTPVIGPNGTFNITVNVAIDPEQAKNGTMIAQQVAKGVDQYFMRKASLVKDAAGTT